MANDVPRAALGAHAETLIADVLDKREQSIIAAVLGKVSAGALDPQFAVQQWLALAESRKLRSSLIRRTQHESETYPKQL